MLMRSTPLPKDHPLPLWQTEEWAKTLRDLGRDAWIEPLHGVGQVLVVSRSLGPFGTLRFASRGPQWSAETSEEDRIEALREARLHVINPDQIDPTVLRSAGYLPLFKPKQVARLSIAGSFDDQLSKARVKWRNAVRQGLKKKLWVSHDPFNADQHGWIFAEDRKQQKKKGFRSPHPVLTRCFAQTNSGQVMVSQMWQGSGVIAAMVFLRHGTSATYHIGWTSDAGRAARAHHVILMKATQELSKKGVSQIDLGFYDTTNAPGLAMFKRGSGADIQSLGGTWIRHPFGRPAKGPRLEPA